MTYKIYIIILSTLHIKYEQHKQFTFKFITLTVTRQLLRLRADKCQHAVKFIIRRNLLNLVIIKT